MHLALPCQLLSPLCCSKGNLQCRTINESIPRFWEPWPLQAPSALKVVVAGSALLEAWQGESACWPLYGGEATALAGCEHSCRAPKCQGADCNRMLLASRVTSYPHDGMVSAGGITAVRAQQGVGSAVNLLRDQTCEWASEQGLVTALAGLAPP